MPRLLFVFRRESTFIAIDRKILAERYRLRALSAKRSLLNPIAVALAVRRCDVVFGWFAHWHSFWPVTLARLMGKRSVLVVGGFDTANMPEIGYGLQRGGWRRWISRSTMKRADRLIVNSEYIRGEIERNAGISADRVTVVHHGIPDPFGELPVGERERMALTVGGIDGPNLKRKGLRAFVETAALLPDVRFVLAGGANGSAVDELLAIAADNVDLPGRVSDERLTALYSRASAYVQASAHEGFGMSVAEAMLAGALPVVTSAGALPEVVGEQGIVVDGAQPAQLAAGIERALSAPAEHRAAARQRVLDEFPLELRRERILKVVAEALAQQS